MQALLQRPGFSVMCDHLAILKMEKSGFRRTRENLSLVNLTLMANIDWFRHTEYSIGATIMNLPRAVRFRQENVMLIGLMPGPPSTT